MAKIEETAFTYRPFSVLNAAYVGVNVNKPTVVSEIDGFLAMEVAHQILDKINNTSILV